MTGKNSPHCCPTWIYGYHIFPVSNLKIFVSLSLGYKMLIRNWAPELELSIAGFIQTLHNCEIWEDQIMSSFLQDLTFSKHTADMEIITQQCRSGKSHMLVFTSPVTWGKKVTLPLSLPFSPAEEQWRGAGFGSGGSLSSSQPSPTFASPTWLLVKFELLKLLALYREERKERGKERKGRKN